MFFFIKLSSVYVSQNNNLPLCSPLTGCRKKGNKRNIFHNNLEPLFCAQMLQPFVLENVVNHTAENLSKVYTQDFTTQNLGLHWTLSPTASVAYK